MSQKTGTLLRLPILQLNSVSNRSITVPVSGVLRRVNGCVSGYEAVGGVNTVILVTVSLGTFPAIQATDPSMLLYMPYNLPVDAARVEQIWDSFSFPLYDRVPAGIQIYLTLQGSFTKGEASLTFYMQPD